MNDLVDHVGDEGSKDRVLHAAVRVVKAADEGDPRRGRHLTILFEDLLSSCLAEVIQLIVHQLDHPPCVQVDVRVERRTPGVLAAPTKVGAVQFGFDLPDELLSDQEQPGRRGGHTDHIQLTFYSVDVLIGVKLDYN